jgi:ectoine hydroxylase-related dioxygenase (phytanoyl-CoA dioxygenase family)
MHLTQAQIRQYCDQGFVLGPRVLDDGQIERLKSRIADIMEGRIQLPERLMGETVTRSKQKGQLPSVKVVNIFRHDKVFAEVLQTEAIGAVAHDLFEGPVRVWEDQMIFKPPFDNEAVLAWHRDYTYWDHVGPAELGTCWIALDDATIDNGCMHVVPGSHRWDYSYHREEVDGHDPRWPLRPERIPADADMTEAPCEVPAGHCHFHHCRTLHGSYGNKTDNPRHSYILHLMPGSTRRTGDNWNERMATVDVPVGAIVQGPQYPELVTPA